MLVLFILQAFNVGQEVQLIRGHVFESSVSVKVTGYRCLEQMLTRASRLMIVPASAIPAGLSFVNHRSIKLISPCPTYSSAIR